MILVALVPFLMKSLCVLNNDVHGRGKIPKLPLPPFVGKPRRNNSAWSSTACGTPTPHSDTPQHSPVSITELRIPTSYMGSESCPLAPVLDSPRIQRSALVGLGPEPVCNTVPPTPACGRLYEYRTPPVPKGDSLYKQAKKAEYDGDFMEAMELYLKAIEKKDRPDSAIKDYAGLLHMRGRTDDAIEFLEKCCRADLIRNTSGLKNLLAQLRSFRDGLANDSEKRDLPRLLYVTMDEELKLYISKATLPMIFPNHLKVSKIFYVNPQLDDASCPHSKKALVEFASHSAARKALMVNKHSSLRCAWGTDKMLDCDPRIVLMNGAGERDSYAIVPVSVVDHEWPKLLQTRPCSPDTVRTESPAIERPLQLPVIKRGETRPIELDIAAIEGSVENVLQEKPWCLDTPSPIRSVACLL